MKTKYMTLFFLMGNEKRTNKFLNNFMYADITPNFEFECSELAGIENDKRIIRLDAVDTSDLYLDIFTDIVKKDKSLECAFESYCCEAMSDGIDSDDYKIVSFSMGIIRNGEVKTYDVKKVLPTFDSRNIGFLVETLLDIHSGKAA